MEIRLTPGGYRCLLDHVRLGSPVQELLKKAAKFTGSQQNWYSIDSDLDIAEILLRIARVHCLSAVKPLEQAVQELTYRRRKR